MSKETIIAQDGPIIIDDYDKLERARNIKKITEGLKYFKLGYNGIEECIKHITYEIETNSIPASHLFAIKQELLHHSAACYHINTAIVLMAAKKQINIKLRDKTTDIMDSICMSRAEAEIQLYGYHFEDEIVEETLKHLREIITKSDMFFKFIKPQLDAIISVSTNRSNHHEKRRTKA